jgi:hypothetical protein
MTRQVLVVTIGILVSCVWIPSTSAQGVDYEVTIRNDFSNTVRFVRVDNSERAFDDLPPGQPPVTFQLNSDSMQVLIAYIDGRIAGRPISFDPKMSEGISLTVSPQGQLIANLRPRQ